MESTAFVNVVGTNAVPIFVVAKRVAAKANAFLFKGEALRKAKMDNALTAN